MLVRSLVLIICATVVWLTIVRTISDVTHFSALPIKSGSDRIVLVGNGPSVTQHDWGNLIDSFDVIVRFNAAKIIPRHTGVKTSIHVITAGSLRTHIEGAWRGIVYNHTTQRFLRPLPCVHCTEIRTKTTYHSRPTTGFVTIAHICENYPTNTIRLVGFDGIRSRDFGKEHYFERNDSSRTALDILLTNVGMNFHPLDERSVIESLMRKNPNLKRIPAPSVH
jgi:hypothetical protein